VSTAQERLCPPYGCQFEPSPVNGAQYGLVLGFAGTIFVNSIRSALFDASAACAGITFAFGVATSKTLKPRATMTRRAVI
jgi:hypothetical protein